MAGAQDGADVHLQSAHSASVKLAVVDGSHETIPLPGRGSISGLILNFEVSDPDAEHARLTAAGRMTPHGQAQVDAAKADGRWDAAYAPQRQTTTDTLPADLRAAIAASPKARATFATLGRRNLFALAFRTNAMKTAAGRARKIASLVQMLERGETIFPERR